ncbi:TPA: hypothetical protein N0F65_000075 [Lagenidium giganteum]|uniref:Transmembrane protein n=1 Tax=Lagenidium giganteum TaxID=4803 RepID=A0AAV2YK46_9STRA|nr:TPA: hypothetical protein N0F65_000075 [Lagenidium giganteum]
MPALVLFGRRSRVGSDDLYCPALFMVLYQVPLLLVAVLYVSVWRSCSSMHFSHRGVPFWFMLGAIPLYGFMLCVYLMVVHVSAKGTIIDHERRMLMPRLLHVHIVWSLIMVSYGVMGLYFWYAGDLCMPDAEFVLVLAAAMVAEVSCTFTFGFCILGGAPHHETHEIVMEPNGNATSSERQALLDEVERSIPNSDVYVPQQQRWERRCNRCCSCIRCFTCNLFGGAGTQHDSMSVVAHVFARLFYGSPDLVISDIVAGFILLAAVQAREDADMLEQADEEETTLAELRRRNKKNLETPNRPPSASMDSHHHHRERGDSYIAIEVPSPPPSSSSVAPESDPELVENVLEFAHFSKYAIGIYGWMLYVWSHPWSGTFRLAFSCMKKNLPYIHGDNFFHLHQTALQLETNVRSQDIVYASFHNSVYRPAFCVVLDHQRKEVVIAIRGTLSLEDCLTDAIAYGMSLDDVAERWGCDGAGEHAHQGFLHCAESVYLDINRLGILEMLFDPNSNASVSESEVNICEHGAYSDYGLVGTAVLLSIILRPRYPRLRCLAFSPPGCTMSKGLANRCDEFVTSIVVGYDIVACSSLNSAEDLRDQVIDLISRSKVGKSEILRQVVAWKKPHELLHEESNYGNSAFGLQLANYRTMLQRIQANEPIHEMTLPGRLIHLRRTAVHPEGGGCWVCCRPGRSVCCTERSDYHFHWSSSEHFRRIRIARTMLDDHFPDKVHHVLQDCASRLRQREFQCV